MIKTTYTFDVNPFCRFPNIGTFGLNWTQVQEEAIIKIILDEAFTLHKALGPGMLEKVYSTCLAYRLRKKYLYVEVEKAIPVVYEEVKLECGYRADLVVENKIVVEIKSIDTLMPIHISQVLTHLRFINLRFGLLLNFNTVYFKNGIKRVMNGFDKQF